MLSLLMMTLFDNEQLMISHQWLLAIDRKLLEKSSFRINDQNFRFYLLKIVLIERAILSQIFKGLEAPERPNRWRLYSVRRSQITLKHFYRKMVLTQGATISPNFQGSRGSRTPKKGGKGGAERGLYIIIFLFVLTIYSAKCSLIASFF